MFRVSFFAVLISVQVFSQLQESSQNLTLRFNDQPLRTVLNEIKNKTGISFIYNDDLVDKITVTGSFENNAPEYAVKNLLGKYGIAYKIFEQNSFVLFKREGAREPKKIYKATLIEQPVPDINPAVLISKPKMIANVNPVYPAEAIKNNIEGNVNLKLFITKEGNIGKTHLVSSSGSSILDSAAVRHTSKLKFFPALENGKPKNVWISMIFKYQITGKNNNPIKK